jgi:DNA polymerase bacteriophage-type
MKIVVLDFETYFADDFTLSRMTTESYIRDPRFQAHGAAIKWGAAYQAKWYDARQLKQVLDETDFSDIGILCHHTNFDGLILAHHYGVRPRLWLDTLAMARLLLGNHLSVSLESVRRYFGLPSKRTPYEKFKGRHWNELDRQTQEELAEGCCDEVESIWTIFQKMSREFPSSQYEVVDCIERMFIDPVLHGDNEFFGRVWSAEYQRRGRLLSSLGVAAADLRSDLRFAELLTQQGVEPGTKQGKNGLIPAFAQTDEFMQELLDSDDDVIAGLAQARLDAESTIQMRRCERLGDMTNRGNLCVYLRPYGARTTRPSGGDKTNWLNFKKRDPDLPQTDDNVSLKGGIVAPEGYWVAPIDSAQGEARLLNCWAGQHDIVEGFRNGDDLYARMAEAIFGYQVSKATHPTERQFGKVVELASGYGMGHKRLSVIARLSEERAQTGITAYRQTHPQVGQLWRTAGRMIGRLAGGEPIEWGPVTIRNQRVYLPNGCPLIYDTIEFDVDANEWKVKSRQGWQKLYGAKLVENICQALHWCFVSDVMVRLNRAGFRTLNVPYDELLLLIPRDNHAQEALAFCKAEMSQSPEWMVDLPMAAEGELQDRYE